MTKFVGALLQRDVSQYPVGLVRAVIFSVSDIDGISVKTGAGDEWNCDFLEAAVSVDYQVGDRVIVLAPDNEGERALVIGRVAAGHVTRPSSRSTNLVIEATDTLTLKCGDASIDLRADGKVMVRGEDVLLRAKGTQRIRAGTVAIN